MGSLRWWFLAGVLCTLAPLPAGAASQPPDTEPTLASPQRIPGLSLNVSEFPGYATVITAEDIKRSGAASVPALLGRYAGVTVMDTNGFWLSADGSVNLRGIVDGSRTNALVLVDGVRQNRVTGDEVHWQSIPIEEVERIEILRGGGSVSYGEGALAGLISITMKKRSEKPLEVESRVAVGSFGQQRYSVAARGRSGPFSYSSSYHRDLLTGYRESTNSRTTTVTESVSWDALPTLHVETNVLHSEDTTSFPGGITPAASQQRRRQRGSFSGFFDEHTEQVGLNSVWHAPGGFSFVADSFLRLREADSATPTRLASINPSQGLSLRTSHQLTLGAIRHTLVSGVELLSEKASVGNRTGKLDESNKKSYGLFTEETLRIMDRASVVAGFRFDRARFKEDLSFPAYNGTLRFRGLTPKVGVSVDVCKPLTLYANFARPFKAPNVDDFSAVVPAGGFVFVSNINLKPEQGPSFETGMHFKREGLGSFDADWFYNRINNQLLFNALTFQTENFNTVRTGIETSFSPALPIPRLTGTITYTHMDAKFRTGAFAHHRLPAVPQDRVTGNLTYEPIPHLFVSTDWLIVHGLFRINDFNNTVPGRDYGVVNLGVRYERGPVTVYGRIDNLFNEEYSTFPSSNGVTTSTGENPAPPIMFTGGVEMRF